MKGLTLFFAFLLILLASEITLAGFKDGKITLYHLNSKIDGRGVCIRMDSGIPGTGWACVWKNKPLYKEITDLLLVGFAERRQCRVTWDDTDPHGHALIIMVECKA
ncbi:MAG: hypothetical protein ACXABY_16320 [Candidatus Thorarchaeota archaeon]|jgi:hypothetical protein